MKHDPFCVCETCMRPFVVLVERRYERAGLVRQLLGYLVAIERECAGAEAWA